MNSEIPSNWREALLSLIAARISLIQIESKDVAKSVARKAIGIACLAFCVVFAWALLLTGGIYALSQAAHWPWYWIAISAGVLHIIAGLLIARCTKTPTTPPFPVTRTEFQKDRTWIENFHKTPK
ncbi:MAG: phage holin family protein [Gloeobacteraceae cyanobacterium ES-bin-144]|nr:phage holin family protein [Verrucomicrobiales bacterium]